MKTLNLPQDYVEFMNSNGTLKYDHEETESGLVGLTPMSKLKPGEVWISSEGSPLEAEDPHAGEEGYYSIPAVSLTNTCENYDPEFILLWLPNEKLFGMWDLDHWDLFVFDDSTWDNISGSPAKYVDAQWEDVDREVGTYFKPFPKYKFKTGRPF